MAGNRNVHESDLECGFPRIGLPVNHPLFYRISRNKNHPAIGVFLWFSYGLPMVVLWFSYGFPMVWATHWGIPFKRLKGTMVYPIDVS